jgi:hypothetical protein
MRWLASRAPDHRADDPEPDADAVIARLEEAGVTLLRMPRLGYNIGALNYWPEVVRQWEDYGKGDPGPLRPARPSAGDITLMDHAFQLLGHIPHDRYVLRRVVGLRALVDPMTDRHIWTWGRIAFAIGADRRTVPHWHRQGIAMIVAGLRSSKS